MICMILKRMVKHYGNKWVGVFLYGLEFTSQTNERLKQKLFWNTPYPWVYIQIWKLTLTSRLAEFLNNPVTCSKGFQNINRISDYPSVWVKHLPTNHDVLLIKHHTKSQGFHGCTLQAVYNFHSTNPIHKYKHTTGKTNEELNISYRKGKLIKPPPKKT